MNAGDGDRLTTGPDNATATQVGVGTDLGPYRIEGLLGSGGMGQVFRARDTRLGRAVAIKISNARFSDRFEREARAISSLNHPHICTLYDVGPNYLVMELVEGTLLKGPLPPDKVLQYAAQICDALEAAHRKGITHRDLKPGNILVTKQGVKVLDFGLAHIVTEPGDPELTQAGAVMGTPAYMAPEQLEGKQADARSDIYAFGCVLYAMITGMKPSKDWPGLEAQPAVLASVLRTCLQSAPDDRWQTASDIERALALSKIEPRKIPMLKQHWLWIAAAMLVIGAGIGVASGYIRARPAVQRALQLTLNPPEGQRFVLGTTEGGIALSADGSAMAYVAPNEGRNSLWLRPLESISARLLTGTEGAAYPFWSSDGRSIGFFAGDKLLRIDLGGGAPTLICTTDVGRGGTFTEDGRILFGGPDGIFQVPASGGIPEQMTRLDQALGEIAHRWPQLLPGGHFLYFAAGDKPEHSKVYVSSVSNPGKRLQLLTTNGNALYAPGGDGRKYLLWLRGEALVAQELDTDTWKLSEEPRAIADPVSLNALSGRTSVTASTTGTLVFNSAANVMSRLTWFNRAGRPLRTLGEPGEYSAFRLSPDGLKAAAARDRIGGTDLWVLDNRNISERLTSNLGVASFPAWFSDGRSFLFAAGNPRNLFKKDANGSEQRLTRSPQTQISSDVSRDGRVALYYEVARTTLRDLWTLSLAPGGATTKPYLRTPFNESWGRFSPEASPRWIAYQSDKSGRYEVYIDTYPDPSGGLQISTAGGTYPQWGDRTTELFYIAADEKLMAVNLKFTSGSVQPSVPQELFPVAGGDAIVSPYEASPDGQRFLVRVGPNRPPVSVIVNWPALLKK